MVVRSARCLYGGRLSIRSNRLSTLRLIFRGSGALRTLGRSSG